MILNSPFHHHCTEVGVDSCSDQFSYIVSLMILLQIVFSYNVFGMGNFRGGEMIFLKKFIWLFSSK